MPHRARRKYRHRNFKKRTRPADIEKTFHSKWFQDTKRPCLVDVSKQCGFSYTCEICTEFAFSGVCRSGDQCEKSHTEKERQEHPVVFRTMFCEVPNCTGTKKCYWKAHECKRDLMPPADPLNKIYGVFRGTEFWVNYFKTGPCLNSDCLLLPPLCQGWHNPKERRRDPRKFSYTNEPCPHVREGNSWLRPNKCPKKDHCEKAHTFSEMMYHHKVFQSQKCQRFAFCKFGIYCTHKHWPWKSKEIVPDKELPFAFLFDQHEGDESGDENLSDVEEEKNGSEAGAEKAGSECKEIESENGSHHSPNRGYLHSLDVRRNDQEFSIFNQVRNRGNLDILKNMKNQENKKSNKNDLEMKNDPSRMKRVSKNCYSPGIHEVTTLFQNLNKGSNRFDEPEFGDRYKENVNKRAKPSNFDAVAEMMQREFDYWSSRYPEDQGEYQGQLNNIMSRHKTNDIAQVNDEQLKSHQDRLDRTIKHVKYSGEYQVNSMRPFGEYLNDSPYIEEPEQDLLSRPITPPYNVFNCEADIYASSSPYIQSRTPIFPMDTFAAYSSP